MKLEINAEIESKGKVRYLRDETYCFVFKINKFIANPKKVLITLLPSEKSR